MSTSAQASTTRQRAANPNATAHPLAPNTDSDGVDHSKDGPQGKKLKETPFTSFFNKLILGAVAISAFYLWRLSVQSAEVGGWWNLIRGKGKEGNVAIKDQKLASSAASSAASTASVVAASARGQTTVQQQILELASALGVKPRQLTEAIAPLLNPSIVSATDPAFADEEESHNVVEDAAAGVGGVLGAAGTILETFVD